MKKPTEYERVLATIHIESLHIFGQCCVKMYMDKNYVHYLPPFVTAVSFQIDNIKVFWKFYVDQEYAIYFISKVSFTKVITFTNTP